LRKKDHKQKVLFLHAKTRLFYYLCNLKGNLMKIANRIKAKLETFAPGEVFTIQSFDIEPQYQPALVRYINKMIDRNEIERLSKGRYYIPRKTRFGDLRPSINEVVKDLLIKDNMTIGYISGVSAYAKLGLTTQIAVTINIGSCRYRRPTKRQGYEIKTFIQKNPITKRTSPLLQILDAIRDFRDIPATTPSSVIKKIIRLIQSLSRPQIESIITLSLRYSSYIRAVLGAILELLGQQTHVLKESLNWVTTYKLGIEEDILPTKSNWNIV